MVLSTFLPILGKIRFNEYFQSYVRFSGGIHGICLFLSLHGDVRDCIPV